MHIKVLLVHESIRARPDMYLGAGDSNRQAAVLLRQTIESVATAGNRSDRMPVALRIWPGPVFELSCPWENASFERVDYRGSSLSVIDRQMMTLFAGSSPSWGLLGAHGLILNALSSRLFLQTSNGEIRREAMYSRGGIISPMQDSSKAPANGSRIVFELDPLFFDEEARAHSHSESVIGELLSLFPWLTVSQRAAEVSAGDPW
ncbi:hypothetical protein [Myxococcus stipitatus]|uniref:hypothetical protein n=1 Tax=Myxococcus stipitatus TaxID=83455 RepID=UPI0030D0A88B